MGTDQSTSALSWEISVNKSSRMTAAQSLKPSALGPGVCLKKGIEEEEEEGEEEGEVPSSSLPGVVRELLLLLLLLLLLFAN